MVKRNIFERNAEQLFCVCILWCMQSPAAALCQPRLCVVLILHALTIGNPHIDCWGPLDMRSTTPSTFGGQLCTVTLDAVLLSAQGRGELRICFCCRRLRPSPRSGQPCCGALRTDKRASMLTPLAVLVVRIFHGTILIRFCKLCINPGEYLLTSTTFRSKSDLDPDAAYATLSMAFTSGMHMDLLMRSFVLCRCAC